MMNASSLYRIGTGAVVAGLVATGSIAGCDFLDSGSSDEPKTVIKEDPTGTQTLLDEEVELVNGESDPIEVDIPEGVYSIAVSVTDGDGNLNYTVTDWQAPDGYELVPDDWTESVDGEVCYPGCNNRVMMSAGAFGGLAPNNPDAEPGVQPGTHEFTVHSEEMRRGMGGDADGSVDVDTVRVLVHTEMLENPAEPPETGELDLNIFLSGAQGWTAASAESDTDLQATIDEIDSLYDQVGIDIDEVQYYDIEGDYDIIEDMFTGTGDMAQMFAQSEQAELEGPSIFFVEELQSPMDRGGRGGVLGISGGIPGPMMVDGSARSGVAIGTDSASAMGAPGIAKVTAHEVGHYLGLYHTTEQGAGWGSGPSYDPLPDTEQNDTSYLMHASGGGDELSEWQGRVMRKNPWVTIE